MALETKIDMVFTEIKNMRKDIKDMSQSYIPQEKLDEEVSRLNARIDKVDKRRWVQNTLSAILGATLAFLIQYFLRGIIG